MQANDLERTFESARVVLQHLTAIGALSFSNSLFSKHASFLSAYVRDCVFVLVYLVRPLTRSLGPPQS